MDLNMPDYMSETLKEDQVITITTFLTETKITNVL